MAYAIVHNFPGGTKENYEASIAAVHPSDGSLPAGQVFRDGILLPRMQEGIEGGFPTPPEEIAIDVYKMVP
jgi:hypothetical protein